ncbi:hypothetical protein FOT50_14805 [Thalassolituus sp. C2-1]|nr:hypothetical protein FOT50_14805 [Thalassolituus sp. C2-1]
MPRKDCRCVPFIMAGWCIPTGCAVLV